MVGTWRPSLGYNNVVDESTSFNINNGTLFPADVEVGSSGNTYFRIHNYGDGILKISSIGGMGGNNNFDIDYYTGANGLMDPPVWIYPGQDFRFILSFQPFERGVETTEITIQNNDAKEGPFNFLVRATAIGKDVQILGGAALDQAIANGDTTPDPVDRTDFGNLEIAGQTLARNFRLRNGGELPLQYISASLSGDTADFSIGNLPVPASFLVPAPLGDHDFTVTFNPTSIGLKTAKITILTDDPDEGIFTFHISGNGVVAVPEPDLEIRGGSGFATIINAGNTTPSTTDGTDFGTAVQGAAAVTRQFLMKNRGGSTLDGIQLSSGNPDATVSGGASSLGAGSSSTFTVTFNSVTPGIQTAVIGIASNDPTGSPYLFTVQMEVEPLDSTPPSIESFELDGANGTVKIKGAAGRTYILTTSITLENDWIQVPGTSPVAADGSLQSIHFTIDPTFDPKRFYRLEVVP